MKRDLKRALILLLALAMVLTLAAPALAAEDAFEAFEAEEAAPEAPIAPEAPVEEDIPDTEAPAEAPDLPQAAAAEPEDTTESEPQTGKLTVLGNVDKLWYVRVKNEAGRTDYIADYEDIPLQEGDGVYLIMDYRYTIQWDKDWLPENYYGVLADQASGGIHTGDMACVVFFDVTSESGCDVTVTVVENPNTPPAIPVTWTAPEGVQVKAYDFVFLGSYGSAFTCDRGYVPVFTGAYPEASYETEDGYIVTSFKTYEDAGSVHVDVRKATGELHITDPEDKVVYAGVFDNLLANGDAGSGLVGGAILSIVVEAGYDVKADVEPYNDTYFEYEGDNVHAYWYNIPETGDIHAEVVKTPVPVEPPKSGTGWAYDEAAGDYYYFVDGVQKSDYWVSSQRGLWYYIGMDGKMAIGFQYVENPNGTGWYMFQTDNKNGCIGRMLTGWQWTWSTAGMGWFNTAHGGLNGQCTYTTAWGAYDAATGVWADGWAHWFYDEII